MKIKFPRINLEKCFITCFSDASLGNLPNSQSSGGYIVFLHDNEGNAAPLSWRSKTLRRVVRSTLAAETSAMVDTLDTAFYLSTVLTEILVSKGSDAIPIHALTDNESLYRNAHSTTMAEERRLRVDIAIIKDMLTKNEIESLKWLPSESQLADSLTKQGADAKKLLNVLESGKCIV